MTLLAGMRLGPYEILAPLGAGGMGEVYRAKDARLGREVAIKVLPASVAADGDRLRRFEQEARAAGILNHPNITAVYDIGADEAGAPYVVSELLEGETLRSRMAGGALSPRKALEYALQIAHGLAAAHERGIVHRDLKPENLFVTKDGRVKILDFGLAKLLRAEEAGPNTSLPTATAGTEPGVALGTPSYMSPEQVRGEGIDHRSDIFSFGTTLYEMLCGQRPFSGATSAEQMSAILRDELPEPDDLDASAPPALARIVRHCLEKSPQNRFQSAADLAFDLEGLSGISAESAIAGSFRSPGRLEHPVYRRLTFRRGAIVSARFSPDAQTIVYTARWESASRETYSMRLDSPESRPLGLPREAILRSISSSGEMAVVLDAGRIVGSVPAGVLARMSLAGGAPRELLEDVKWADWSPDGSALAVVRTVDGRDRLEYPIGAVLYEPTGWIAFPRVSPDGDRVAFLDYPRVGDTAGTVAVVDRKGGLVRLSEGWNDAIGLAWGAHGKEIWFTGSRASKARALHAVTLEGRDRLVEEVPGGLYLHDISRGASVLLSGEINRAAILCRTEGQPSERELSWFDYPCMAALSDDGKTLLFSEGGAGGGPLSSVYLRKTDGSPAVMLGEGCALALSPDGKWSLSLSISTGRLLLVPTGAGQTRELVHEDLTHHAVAAWFPDGKSVLFAANQEGRQRRSYVQRLESTEATPVTPEGTIAYAISPDGRYLVVKDESLSVCRVDGADLVPIPGTLPEDVPLRWHQDGLSIFVRSGFVPANVFRVYLTTGIREPFLELTPPDPAGVSFVGHIALTPDGRSYAYSYGRILSDLYVVDGLN